MCQLEFLQKVIEPIPIVALSLASPVQPEEQDSAYFAAEVVQAVEVVSYPVVMEVTHQNLVQLMDNVLYWFRPHFFDALVYLAAFLDKLLPAVFPLHSELAVPAFGTVVYKARKVEGLRLALSGAFAVLCRKSAKFQ